MSRLKLVHSNKWPKTKPSIKPVNISMFVYIAESRVDAHFGVGASRERPWLVLATVFEMLSAWEAAGGSNE